MHQIKFESESHQKFYLERIAETTDDVYFRSFWYTLGLSPTTRRNYRSCFDFSGKAIITGAINDPWQTGSSVKATCLAFNLFNSWAYDSDADADASMVSKRFVVDEIFCDSLAPYFFEAIRIRYPNYTGQ